MKSVQIQSFFWSVYGHQEKLRIWTLFTKWICNRRHINALGAFKISCVSALIDITFYWDVCLTHLFPMHLFSTAWKKVFRGYRKGALGTNGLMFIFKCFKSFFIRNLPIFHYLGSHTTKFQHTEDINKIPNVI